MQPLTDGVWSQHHERLRSHLRDEWPELTSHQLEAVGPDYEALIRLVADETGMSPARVRQRLEDIDVDELDAAEPGDEGFAPAGLDEVRLGDGFTEADRPRVLRRLHRLERRLRRFPAESTELEISVKDRETTSQKVTLEAWLPNMPHIVATSKEADLQAALIEVREDLWRQIDSAVNKRKPYA